MKKLIFAGVVLGGMSVFAADPNPYANYTSGMASDKSHPMAVEWQNANDKAIKEATTDEALAAFVKDAASAKALLAQVKPNYGTDPMTAVQIAAVSQYVMRAEPSWWEFWTWFSDSPRDVWTTALVEARDAARDDYVKAFMRDQLVWCGTCEQQDRAPCRASCPYGSWGLTLPFDTMNAGHLILAKGANGTPKATLLWRWGSPFDISGNDLVVEKDGFTLTFDNHKPKDLPPDRSAWRRDRVAAKIRGDWAVLTLQKVDGNGKAVGKAQVFSGKRNPPIVGPAPDLTKAVRGTPISILSGTMNDFELMEPNKVNGWTLKDGVLSNRIQRGPDGKSLHKNGNLRTKREDFFDFNLTYEVRVLPGCNSGVYLRGRYEIQVFDSYGLPVNMHNMAAYYGRVTPRVAVEKQPGEWQTVNVTLYRRHLTVILNGVNIIDNVPVVGITGGAMSADEFVPGPIYIQGDHSDADFRNMVLTPLK